MMNDPAETGDGTPELSANPGYVLGQLAHALTTQQHHSDAATRERAAQKVGRWIRTLQGMLSGTLDIGSRTPVVATPAWVTLDVATGGFATGSLLAEGPLQPHEIALLQQLPPCTVGSERAAINSYYLSEAGFAVLQKWLADGCYRIHVPEEGALLVIAWLAGQGYTEEAHALLAHLGPFINRLRFYPVSTEHPRDVSATVYRQTVGQTVAELQALTVPPAIEREREALLIWAPLYDRTIALLLETVEDGVPFVPLDAEGQPQRRPNGHYIVSGGWPCQQYPAGWAERAQALLAEYREQRRIHQRSAKPDRADESFALLRAYLERCIQAPDKLTGREVGQIRALLAAFAVRRGVPGSPRHQALRQAQIQSASAPTIVDVAQALLVRLTALPQDDGLHDFSVAVQPITATEAETHHLIVGQPIPQSLMRKIERSRAATIDVLVAHHTVPSSEVLARMIPQLSAHVRVMTVVDPALRQLYSELYMAFRRRRSLLLFNLRHQVTFQELPWVLAIEPYRIRDQRGQQLARELLQQVVALAITAFPQQILPNTLLREIQALAESAGLALPIVDEVAADIFMDAFSEKYLYAAQWAGTLLTGSLYERYYAIDYTQVQQFDDVQSSRFGTPTSERFVQHCRERAGTATNSGRRSVARNGMIIEQEQILTTHNLAVLVDALDLTETLRPQLYDLAQRCFVWICVQQQRPCGTWQANLRMLKNTAYACRQMIFFLALVPDEQVLAFLNWATQHLGAQTAAFQESFRPALDGLAAAAAGRPVELPTRRLLGWTTERHWLMPEEKQT